MTQNTNLNVSPYFDDFNESKNYNKVLFKPGFPVQARELTTLQSILQNQVERFGQHFFKEGSIVIPGSTFYDADYFSVKIDPNFVATQSKIVLKKIIREKINFKGLIMSDDIWMKALKGNLLSNAKKSLQSGCNLILYCGGDTNDSSLLLKGTNKIDKFTVKKTQQFYEFLR